MKTNTSWKKLVIVVGLGFTLFGVTAFPAVSEAMAHSELSGGPATVTVRRLNAVDSCGARVHASAELFHPGGRWTSTGELNIGRYAHTATLLPNGKVLVAGGVGSDTCFTPTSSAELYDPDSATWTPTGSLNTARFGHTATLLQNGLVLVAGGYAGGYLNSAELYDPGTGTWHPTGSFKTIRALWNDTSAALLSNGKVLVLGRSASDLSAELYDQEIGTWSSTSPPNVFGGHMVVLPDGTVLACQRRYFEGFGAVSAFTTRPPNEWSPPLFLGGIIFPIPNDTLRTGTS